MATNDGSALSDRVGTAGRAITYLRVVVTGRWLDTYLMVAPSLAERPRFPLYAVAASFAVLLGMLILAQRRLRPTS